jgi:sRNA-binding protein
MHDNTDTMGEAELVSNRRARREQFRRTIATLADLFPAAFVADKRAPHRPLKVGIHADLIATGLVTPREVRNAPVIYDGRRMYQAALAAGGPRFDLDGNIAGEVTPDQVEHAADAVARIEAKTTAKVNALRKQKAARKAARERWEATQELVKPTLRQGDDRPPKFRTRPKPAENTSPTAFSASTSTPKASPPSDSAPRRFSLTDLKAAAAARRNGGAS